MADKIGKPNTSYITDTEKRLRYAPTLETDIYYPESDGKPMAETDLHRDAMIKTIQILSEYYKEYWDVYISGNLMMYYIKGNPRKSISPDVFVAFGVGKKQRRTYQIWNEGKPPDFVLEFSSENTYRNDLNAKKDLYASIGITEYFLHDPERRHLPSPLMGFRLVDGEHADIPPDADGHLFSDTLGLSLRLRGEGLGFYDNTTEKWLETPAEAAAIRADEEKTRAEQEAARAEQETAARKTAESLAQQEADARKQAEAEIARLQEEINQLKA